MSVTGFNKCGLCGGKLQPYDWDEHTNKKVCISNLKSRIKTLESRLKRAEVKL